MMKTNREWGQFKLVKGRNGPTIFLPISQDLGRSKKAIPWCRDCLMPRQTNFIYKKVELGSLINKNTVKEELDTDAELDRMDDNNGDENPYRDAIVNNADSIEMSHSPMEQWSILSNVINYVQHSRNPLNFHFATIKPAKLNMTVKVKDKSKFLPKVNLIESSGRSREEYLDRYRGIKTEIVDTSRFDENSDLSTTYLGRIDMTQDKDLMVEQRFPISKSGYTVGKPMDRTEFQILLDTGASKSFMCMSHYLCCKALHFLPKFA